MTTPLFLVLFISFLLALMNLPAASRYDSFRAAGYLKVDSFFYWHSRLSGILLKERFWTSQNDRNKITPQQATGNIKIKSVKSVDKIYYYIPL